MPPDEFDIRISMGIRGERSDEIEVAVRKIFQRDYDLGMSVIIEKSLNTIPRDTKEAIWTIVLIIKYEDVARFRSSAIN